MESLASDNSKELTVAITGCIHGSLKKLYDDLEKYEISNKVKIDLVICSGDFESLITQDDLNYLSCPQKYKVMGDFSKFYNGLYKIPYLTIFIGGNHEASNILNSNFYGGYIMEKIYYLGRSGVINVKGLRIAGISGIFNTHDYMQGHYENDLKEFNQMKSIFHVREFDICKLSNLSPKNKIDIFVSHDWPTNIVNQQDIKKICKINPNWKEELENKILGSLPNNYLLNLLKPKIWLCGHMHYYYENTIYFNDKEIDNCETNETNNSTKIYCLDKCLPKRKYFSVVNVKQSIMDMDTKSEDIFIDAEWINITKKFNQIFPFRNDYYNYKNLMGGGNNKLYVNLMSYLFGKYINRNDILNYQMSNKFLKELDDMKNQFNKKIKVDLNMDQYDTIVSIFGIKGKDVHKLKCQIDFGNDSNNSNNNLINNEANSEEINIDL